MQAQPKLPANGFLIAAPHSGSGKTTFTLGLLRALRRNGIGVSPAKAGPDYIDPAFHAAASGQTCINLDPWAMRPGLLRSLAASRSAPLIIEGMMGLFDGAADGSGSAADLAVLLDIPVVLVIDASSQSHSIAALVSGFRDFRRDLRIAGVVLNRVGSQRHETMLRDALTSVRMKVLGVLKRSERLERPSRHLGLVQAGEDAGLEDFLEAAASLVEDGCELQDFFRLNAGDGPSPDSAPGMPPPGQVIAVASDIAFSFAYPHLLDGWRGQGATLRLFSPLADDAPDRDADAVFLPGGYPELHAGRLAAAGGFLDGMRQAAAGGAFVYGECGGYMVLGEALVDANGNRHTMANLLPLVTSFENRKLSLGYRLARPLSELPFITDEYPVLKAHEFHYSTIANEGPAEPLFAVSDAAGSDLGHAGLRRRNVMGSYMHIIDMASWKDRA